MPVFEPMQREIEAALAAESLPALPDSAVRVLELSRDPGSEPVDLAEAIEADMGLAGQVLRFANSSYFGFRYEIASVRQAIALVGMRTIHNFVLWTAAFSAVPDPKCGGFSLKSFRTDALRRGLFARLVADRLNSTDADGAFTAALLQDLAVPLLAARLGDDYAVLLEQRQDGAVRLSYLEHKVLGWTHADAAAVLFKKWNLPGEIGDLVASHCTTGRPGMPPSRLAVALSALLPAESDNAWPEEESLHTAWRQVHGQCSPTVGELLGEVDRMFGDLAATVGLAQGVRPLAGRVTAPPHCSAPLP